MSPFLILVGIAILLVVGSFFWGNMPLLNVAVLLIAVALLIGKGA